MKKTLLLLMCLLGKYVSAQYFMHTYGNATTNELNAQFVPCSDANQGYMLAGITPGAAGNFVHVVRPDNNGLLPAPHFNNMYVISDPGTGVLWNSWATTIAEINVGAGVFDYAVGGVTINPTSGWPELLIMRLNAGGGVIYVKSFTLTGYILKDPKLKMAINGVDILVTGRCLTASNPEDVYAFSINSNTGIANWGFAYDMMIGATSLDDAGRDIVENPYAPAGAPEIVVVGRSSGDGLFFKIDANTGASIAGSAVRYNLTQRDELVSIKVSGNPLVTTNDAFVVCGNIDASPVNVWTMLIDQAGAITWSTDHDSNNPNIPNFCNEIMERVNTSAAYEYYTVGTMVQATNDVQVLKLDNTGMLVANGEFIYGLATDEEIGMSIGFSNTGGFTASGHTDNGAANYDQLLINAYFNGVTACNYNLKNFTSNSNTPAATSPTISDNNPNTDFTLTSSNNALSDNPICFANTVAAGNNAFSIRTPKPDLFNFDIAANGQSGSGTGNTILLKLENNHSANIEVYLIDLMGRSISCQLIYSGSGNDWQLTTPGGMASGLYYITLSDGVERCTKAYFVK